MSKKTRILAQVQRTMIAPENVFDIRDDSDFLRALADHVECQGPADFDTLPPLGRLIVCIYALDMAMENGELGIYLGNSDGDFAEETRRHLREMGSVEIIRVLDAIASRFPSGHIPEDRETRNDIMERLDLDGDGDLFMEEEAQCRLLDEKLIPLLRKYLDVRRDEVIALLRLRSSEAARSDRHAQALAYCEGALRELPKGFPPK